MKAWFGIVAVLALAGCIDEPPGASENTNASNNANSVNAANNANAANGTNSANAANNVNAVNASNNANSVNATNNANASNNVNSVNAANNTNASNNANAMNNVAECVEATDCPAERPICDVSGECVSCTEDAACADAFPGESPVCGEDGACHECGPSDETLCLEQQTVCDMFAGECDQVSPNSLSFCEECSSSSACLQGAVCAMDRDQTWRCLPRNAANNRCLVFPDVEDAETAEGESFEVCFLDEVTTCDAYLATRRSQTSCDPMNGVDCPEGSECDGGFCRMACDSNGAQACPSGQYCSADLCYPETG